MIETGQAMSHPLCLLASARRQVRVVSGDAARRPVRLTVTNQQDVHVPEDRVLGGRGQYDCPVTQPDLLTHLTEHALRTDGPFTLRSGAVSSWYVDARQTTFDGVGAHTVGRAVLEALDPGVEAVGGMTMGADPIAMATVMVGTGQGRELRAFSIRQSAKDHGTGGRLVGPVTAGARVAILEDTTTTGGAAAEAAACAADEGLVVVQAIALIDRSDGATARRFADMGIPYMALVLPEDLGVGG